MRARRTNQMHGFIFGTIHFLSKQVLMASSGAVYRTKKHARFLSIAIHPLMEGMLHSQKRLPRYYNPVFSGLLFSGMPEL